jgi:hypothetical protein
VVAYIYWCLHHFHLWLAISDVEYLGSWCLMLDILHNFYNLASHFYDVLTMCPYFAFYVCSSALFFYYFCASFASIFSACLVDIHTSSSTQRHCCLCYDYVFVLKLLRRLNFMWNFYFYWWFFSFFVVVYFVNFFYYFDLFADWATYVYICMYESVFLCIRIYSNFSHFQLFWKFNLIFLIKILFEKSMSFFEGKRKTVKRICRNQQQ